MFKRITAFFIASLLALSLFAGITASATEPQSSIECKNVILMIGSGMSPSHVKAASVKLGRTLNIERLQYSGTLETTNSNNAIADPAAAATALSTGKRTTNFRLGVDANDNETLLITEALQAVGKKVGIITDKNLNDATTAAFSVHNTLKSDYYGIARQQIASGLDLFLGGGSKYYDNYRDSFAAAGYEYVTTPQRLDDMAVGKKYFGAFSNYTFETGYNVPTLSQMLTKATEVLDNENGFFIVAEGGLIDKYSFARNMTKMTSELGKFDDAVGVAMSYVDEHPDTLLLVVGDVEAGNLELPERVNSGNVKDTCFKSYGTSSLPAALYTYGANASAFTGEHVSTDVPKFIAASLGITSFGSTRELISSERDYIVEQLNSFSSWTFTNVKKNSSINGVKLTTTSSNNSAVTARCANGSLVIMANAKVGFELTVTPPLATPFKLKNGGSTDLSGFDGFVITAPGLSEYDFEITVGKGSEFSAKSKLSLSMANRYNEIIIPFSAFEPAITPENAIGLDTFKFSSEGCATKTTIMFDSIHAYKIDEGLNYYEALGVAYTKDPMEYTDASFAPFAASLEACESAASRADRYAAKVDLLNKIEELVPVSVTAENFDIMEANAGAVDTESVAYAVGESGIDIFCGAATSSVTFNTIPEKSGNYSAVRLRLDSLNPDATCGDFAVSLILSSSAGEETVTVQRCIIDSGYYYFPINTAVSDITAVKVQFENALVGAAIRIEAVELVSAAQAKAKFVKTPSALEILRAAAGFAVVENGDLDGDGRITVADALIALRAAAGLA